mgnify:CR=1 FL=1
MMAQGRSSSHTSRSLIRLPENGGHAHHDPPALRVIVAVAAPHEAAVDLLPAPVAGRGSLGPLAGFSGHLLKPPLLAFTLFSPSLAAIAVRLTAAHPTSRFLGQVRSTRERADAFESPCPSGVECGWIVGSKLGFHLFLS